MWETKKITRLYNALVQAFVLHYRIERLVRRYNFYAIYDAAVRCEIEKLTTKMNQLTFVIETHKKALET